MCTIRGDERKAEDGSDENPLTRSSSRELPHGEGEETELKCYKANRLLGKYNKWRCSLIRAALTRNGQRVHDDNASAVVQ